MPSDQSIHRFTRLVFTLSTVIAFSIICFSLLLYIEVNKSSDAWRNYSDRAVKVRLALSNLTRSTGYGGFIHNFKNLVLRRDPQRYTHRIDEDIIDVRSEIDKLEQLLKSRDEKRALNKVRATFEEYFSKYELAKKLIARGLSPVQIDQRVKVSDVNAIRALNELSDRINETLQKSAEKEDHQLSQVYYIGIGGSLYLFLLLVTTSGVKISLMRHLTNTNLQLKKSQNEAMRANAALTKFLGSMSHEMRTPLNAMIGFAQLLDLKLKDDDLKTHAHEIVTAGDYLIHLVNELLDLTAIETGNIKLQFEDHDLGALTREAIEIVRPLARKRSIRIENETPQNQSFPVHIDVRRFQQVLLNILSNAIKFNRENGLIKIRLENPENYYKVSVEDTGKGLSAEQMEKIFLPFERLGIENQHIEGTGLGMSISKELLEKMGGDILVESKIGVGTKVSVIIPMLNKR